MAIQKTKEVLKEKETKKEIKEEVVANTIGERKIDEGQFHKEGK